METSVKSIGVRVALDHDRAACPVCGRPSRSMQDIDSRQITDLPYSGVRVTLLQARRAGCLFGACPVDLLRALAGVSAHRRRTQLPAPRAARTAGMASPWWILLR